MSNRVAGMVMGPYLVEAQPAVGCVQLKPACRHAQAAPFAVAPRCTTVLAAGAWAAAGGRVVPACCAASCC